MKRFINILDGVMIGVEIVVVFGLVAMSIGAVWELLRQLYEIAQNGMGLTHSDYLLLIGTVLEVFIIVELFRIAVAYMKHQNVIPTVLEAALVAVARKFVVFESADNYLEYALGLSALLLAVAVGWYLLEKSDVCRLQE